MGCSRRSAYTISGAPFTLWGHQEVRGVLNVGVDTPTESDVLHEVRMTACAGWDTVSSLGIATQRPPRPPSFVGKQVPKCIVSLFSSIAHFRHWHWTRRDGNLSHACGDPESPWSSDAPLDGWKAARSGRCLLQRGEFTVSKLPETFQETRILSAMQHSG